MGAAGESSADEVGVAVGIDPGQQALSTHAQASLITGRSKEALSDLRVILKLQQALRNEPFLVSALVGASIAGSVPPIIAAGLDNHAWDRSQVKELSKLTGSVNLLEVMAKSLRL